MAVHITSRADAEAIIREQVISTIFQDAPKQSTFLSMARKLPNMTSNQTRMRVLDFLPTAYWVDGDTGMKQTTRQAWDNVFIEAAELAVIVPIPEAVLDDAEFDIFGEITPKTIATMKNESMALVYSGIIYTITTILTPVIYVVNLFSGLLCRLFGIMPGSGQTMTELELRTIVDVSQESGVIEKEEKELINNVFDFGDSVAKDIMLPRIDVAFASVDMSYDELVEIFLAEQYSRLPVYEESKDNVIGILNLKDLFFYRETHRNEVFDIYKVLREPFFTYEYQKTSTLMEEMRNNSISFAIVLDEYGSTAGLVTLEDLIEEIVGDIKDEFDDAETDAIRCIGTDEYEIEGSTKLDDLNDVLGTEIESDDYDSIGGHMIELLDHLPKEGETVKEGNYLYSIKKMDKNRVEIVYLKIERHTSESEETSSEV